MRIYFFLLLIFLSITAFGQEITIKNGFFGLKYYQDDVRIKESQVQSSLKPFDEQYQLYMKSRKNQILGDVIQIPGGFMVGWQLGNLIVDRPVNTTSLLIGGGLSVIGIVVSSNAIKGKKRAISEYNMLQNPSNQSSGVEVRIEGTTNGLGLQFEF